MSDEDRFRSALLGALCPEVPAPDPRQLRVMYSYYRGVVDTNQRFNLTRIVDPAEAAVKHFADSISLLGWVQAAGVDVSNMLDVGSGAGFPAAPLAIMRPDWQVTAIDSTAKKVRFVAETSARLQLGNLLADHRRAGEWTPPRPFDLVTNKAVAGLAKCIELSRRLVREDGHAVAYKTDRIPDAERKEALAAADRYRFDPAGQHPYGLRFGEETVERTLWIFRRQRRAHLES